MRRGIAPPQEGENWAGWAKGYDNVRKLSILKVLGPDSYLVEYTLRSVGKQQEESCSIYLIAPWEQYRRQQAERLAENRKCREIQKDLHQAMSASRMTCPRPWIYPSNSGVHLQLDEKSAQILLSALQSMDLSNQSSSLEKLFR